MKLLKKYWWLVAIAVAGLIYFFFIRKRKTTTTISHSLPLYNTGNSSSNTNNTDDRSGEKKFKNVKEQHPAPANLDAVGMYVYAPGKIVYGRIAPSDSAATSFINEFPTQYMGKVTAVLQAKTTDPRKENWYQVQVSTSRTPLLFYYIYSGDVQLSTQPPQQTTPPDGGGDNSGGGDGNSGGGGGGYHPKTQ